MPASVRIPPMQSLRGSRRLARFVAAWLLAWFAVMQGTALLRAPGGLAADAVASMEADTLHEDHAGHAMDDEEHTGAEHIAQCPGCLFSTAPPPQEFALAQAVHAPAEPPALAAATAPRAHPLPQPPARGPPTVS
jgi:hypothetical protein